MRSRKIVLAAAGVCFFGLAGGRFLMPQPGPQYITCFLQGTQATTIWETSRTSGERVSSPEQYQNLAICQATGHVNVRQQPNTASPVVGKMQHHSAATIVASVNGEGGTWYQIQSGTVIGYVKASYFLTGAQAEAVANQVGICYATINTAALRLRAEPNLNSQTLTTLRQGAEYIMLGEENHFARLAVDETLTGYVSMDYIKTRMVFPQAVSLAEEAAQQEEAARRKQEAEAALQKLEEVKMVEAKNDITPITQAQSPSSTAPTFIPAQIAPNQQSGQQSVEQIQGIIAANPLGQGDNPRVEAPGTTTAPTGVTMISPAASPVISYGPGGNASKELVSATRTALVAYARQFLGGPYRYGGDSLTDGADCSGFVMRIFEHFGITTGRNSREQAGNGRQIAIEAVQPGDLLFYASGDTINHVAIYIGGGQVIHAASERTGIIISPADYRTACRAVSFLD